MIGSKTSNKIESQDVFLSYQEAQNVVDNFK